MDGSAGAGADRSIVRSRRAPLRAARLAAILAGLVVGGLAGAWYHYQASSDVTLALLTAQLGILLLTLVLVIVVAIWAMLRHTWTPGYLFVAVIAGTFLGNVIGPTEPSRTIEVSGTASIARDGTAAWSGPVTCSWLREDVAVRWVDGIAFALPGNPAPRTAHAGETYEVRSLLLEAGMYPQATVVYGPIGHPEEMSPVSASQAGPTSGRTGSIDMPAPGYRLTFAWDCSSAPGEAE